jgi:hypothetical protein
MDPSSSLENWHFHCSAIVTTKKKLALYSLVGGRWREHSHYLKRLTRPHTTPCDTHCRPQKDAPEVDQYDERVSDIYTLIVFMRNFIV